MKYLLLTIIAPVMKKTVQKFTCYGALLVNYWYNHWKIIGIAIVACPVPYQSLVMYI